MVQVFLGLGSNVNRKENIRLALNALEEKFGSLQRASFYESNAIDQKGESYYNTAVGLETDIPLNEFVEAIKGIEINQGRDRSKPELVPIDIDLLLFGGIVSLTEKQKIPHPDILAYTHVLIPLAEIAGDFTHPITGEAIKKMCGSNLDRADLNKIERL
ncbi:MAG: 2-amino-4-hydroxy-6-hydroxymethyldihydropteridine diphosphokinase [Cellvibrionaceae bacterium]